MGKNNIEELPEMVPGELADAELLEREQERIAEEKARETKLQEKETNNPPRKFTVKRLTEVFADLNKLLKKLGWGKAWIPTPKVFVNREECSWCIFCFQANL